MLNRSRPLYALLTIVVIGLGLLSRKPWIPVFIYPYLGDFLYTLMFFGLMGFLFPKARSSILLLGSVGLCFLIEFSQLLQTPWMVEIRSYRLGGLILGYGFLWSDLVSYTLGGLTGFVLERLFLPEDSGPD